MKTIHKYVLTEGRGMVQPISTFERARFLHVAEQGGQIAVWAEVHTLERECTRTLRIVMTGGIAPGNADFLGTALLDGGAFVAHVYADREALR